MLEEVFQSLCGGWHLVWGGDALKRSGGASNLFSPFGGVVVVDHPLSCSVRGVGCMVGSVFRAELLFQFTRKWVLLCGEVVRGVLRFRELGVSAPHRVSDVSSAVVAFNVYKPWGGKKAKFEVSENNVPGFVFLCFEYLQIDVRGSWVAIFCKWYRGQQVVKR